MLVTLEDFQASRYWRSDFSPTEAEAALLYAETRFYTLTNRERYGYWLEARELTYLLDGNGEQLIRSPYPICELVSCRVLEEGVWVVVTGSIRARRHFLFRSDGVFPLGFATVEVTAIVGDPQYYGRDVPEDVKEAVRRLAHMKLRRHYRIAGEELDERRPPTEAVPPPTLTGDREVDGIIRTYRIADPLFYLDPRGPVVLE